MNFSISGNDGGLLNAVVMVVLVVFVVGLVFAVFSGLWRTRRGAPTIDHEPDPEA